MFYLQHHYFLHTKKELLSKFFLKNINQFPFLQNIHLNIGILNQNKYFLIPTVLLLELLINQKYIKLNKSKKNNLILKIKKNTIVGCSIVLKKKEKYLFLQKLLLFFFNSENKIPLKLNQKNFSFQIHNLLIFLEIEKYFHFFNKINHLTVTMQFNTTNKLHIQTLLTSLKIPLK